jgi:RNA polymerase sigma-70 factor (ECF subfamily)
LEEKILIEQAQQGDRKSLAKLVKNYEQTVYNFAFKVCRNKDKAEHAMQETFMSMVKSLKQFSGKSKLSTWLYTIVSNHCMMQARSNKNKFTESLDNEDVHLNETEFAEWKVTPDQVTENNELKNILDEAIQKLPSDYKIVFLLRDVEGLSTEETGKIVDLSIPAVKSRLHRARAFLRNELNEVLRDGKA